MRFPARADSSKDASPRVAIWGVLNCTPDSFSDGGRYLNVEAAVTHGLALVKAGADVVDVGGESSRPKGATYGEGFEAVSAEEEAARVVPVIARLSAAGVSVSIDTIKPVVARAAVAAGARFVNDVSCGRDEGLFAVVAESEVDYVLMHTRGQGEVSVENTAYADVVGDVLRELLETAARAQQCGVPPDRVILDPGIGFAKTARQSAALLAGTEALVASGHRVLVGPSRKSFIADLAEAAGGERPTPSEREPGTAAAVALAVVGGAWAVRVHDVSAMFQAVRLAEAVRYRVS